MFQIKKPFEREKLQLQELNQRLGQYLSRAQLLEQENARLIAEINVLKQSRCEENKHMAELKEMRRLMEQLSLEKCRAELERQNLRRNLQLLQAMRLDESTLSKHVDGELKVCEKQLRQDVQTNDALEKRLLQLQNEYALLEDAHRNEMAQLRSYAHSRALPAVTLSYRGPPAFSTQEIQEYALSLSESWMDTFEIYRQQVEEIEDSIKADQVRLENMRREKMKYAEEVNVMRAEMEKHSRIQLELEEQLIGMQERFRRDVCHYQVIIEDLEHERMLLANTISEKLKDHQDLLQVKMGLNREMAAYRALLEEEGRHTQMISDQQSRERIIDIKLTAHPYTPRVSTMTVSTPKVRRNFIAYDAKKTKPLSSMVSSSVSSRLDSHGASRILSIKPTISNRAQQSRPERRDMISFDKAKQAAGNSSSVKPDVSASESTKEVTERRNVIVKELSPQTPGASSDHCQKEKENRSVSTASKVEMTSVRVVSPPMMSLSTSEETHQKVVDNKIEGKTQFVQNESVHEDKQNLFDSGKVGPKVYASEEKNLDSVSMEEIIEKVMKPAGLDMKLSSSADSKITYHVEKSKQEDGSTKTEIVLQSKVEEDIDMSDHSALEDLFSKGVQKVSLEDLEGTPTGSMIQNLLSLGLQGESLENKSVKVQIIETPMESLSDEMDIEMEKSVEDVSKAHFQPSSMFCHIEEPDNELQQPKQPKSAEEALTSSEYVARGFVQVQEVSKEESLPYESQGLETQEYIVSTPEDNMSGSDEGGGIMSYGHYGLVDDLSDERYYQEDVLISSRRYSDEDSSRESLEYENRESFPECIIEEEVLVSPAMKESVLEILKEDSLDSREQLKGALEQLEGTVSGALQKELAVFTKASQGSDNLNITKVEQVTGNGTTTVVAELSVSQSLEESGLLDESDHFSQEKVLASHQSSSPNLHQVQSTEASGFKKEIQTEGNPWITSLEETEDLSSANDVYKTENVIRLGPNERSFTFQMDVNNSSSGSSLGGMDSQGQRHKEASVLEFSQTQMNDPSLKVYGEKQIATIYLESPKQD